MDPQKLCAGALETVGFLMGPLALGALPVLTFANAVNWGLQLKFFQTALGRVFRVVSDNQDIAQLMGLSRRHVSGIAMALALSVTVIAGILFGIRISFEPSIVGVCLIFGCEVVIMDGLGNLWGALAGGVIVGVAQTVGDKIDPGWQILSSHIAFPIILTVRPNGLFPGILE